MLTCGTLIAVFLFGVDRTWANGTNLLTSGDHRISQVTSAETHCATVVLGANLTVTIGGIALTENAGPRPIRFQVTAQNSGDREDMVLVADKTDPNVGKASLPTREHEAVPTNGILDVTRGDVLNLVNTGL